MLGGVWGSFVLGKAFGRTVAQTVISQKSHTSIVREVGYMVRRLGMNETIEAVLSEFAGRAHIEDADSFADVLQTCKRTGGNTIEIIRNTSNVINDKIEIRQEIDTMLAERRFERKVLNVLPVLMLILLSASAGDYMYPIFHTAAGRVVITAAIALLTAAYFIARKIMEIEV
jgi:tight adherence protein B